jgi:hypothetical protein
MTAPTTDNDIAAFSAVTNESSRRIERLIRAHRRDCRCDQREEIMIYTEDEAKEKWCPMVRMMDDSSFNHPVAYNRCWLSGDTEDNPDEARCIGSRCMAWRWFIANEKGYCGLAGG